MKKRYLTIFASLLAIVGTTDATTRYVAQNGQTPDPTPPAYTNWSTASSNIQDAVDAAVSGDVILVNTGRYTSTVGNVVVIENKALELVGIGGRDKVVIDGQGARRGIRTLMQSASGDLRIAGLTITNAVTTAEGGGIYARWMGAETGSLTVDNVMITHCRSENTVGGGGLFLYPNGPIPLIMTNCIIRNNQAAGGDGGGILLGYSTKLADGSLIVDSELTGNETSGGGGGVLARGSVTLRNTLIAENATGGNHGGGVYVSAGSADIEHCIIRDNYGGYGGGVYATASMTLRNCLLYGNSGHRGGAVSVNNGAAALVSIENSTLVGNRSRDVGSGGIYILGGACTVTNSIVYYNQYINGSSSADNMYIALSGGVPQGTLTMAFSCMNRPAPPAGFDNIELAPEFIDPGSNYGTNHIAGDYHLAKGAPCIDAGTNVAWTATAFDLDGNPRRDGSFGIVDMGVYEYMYSGTLITVK